MSSGYNQIYLILQIAILENTYKTSCVSKRREKFTLNINIDHWIIFIDKEVWLFNRHLWKDTFVDYNFHIEYLPFYEPENRHLENCRKTIFTYLERSRISLTNRIHSLDRSILYSSKESNKQRVGFLDCTCFDRACHISIDRNKLDWSNRSWAPLIKTQLTFNDI